MASLNPPPFLLGMPKSHQVNKWRMIVDLSSPRGHSINDGISQELSSLKYAKVDDAVARILQLGRGMQLVKFFDLLHLHRGPNQYTRLNTGARADLVWWRCFMQKWNGSSFFPLPTPGVHVYSASGSFGCGAVVESLGSSRPSGQSVGKGLTYQHQANWTCVDHGG